MVVVTGGAGFIGSAIIQALNERGATDLIVVDETDHPEKKKKSHLTQVQRTATERCVFE